MVPNNSEWRTVNKKPQKQKSFETNKKYFNYSCYGRFKNTPNTWYIRIPKMVKWAYCKRVEQKNKQEYSFPLIQ